MMTRTHFRLPADLLEEIERIVGKRKRNRFVEEAIREHLRWVARTDALEKSAGVLSDANYPEWTTPEDVLAWVRKGREADDRRTAEKLGETR